MRRLTELESEPARAAVAAWFIEADWVLSRLNRPEADALRAELEARIIVLLDGDAAADAARVAAALHEAGEPGEILPPVAADRAARAAARTLHPARVIEALRYGAMSGVARLTAVTMLALVYMLALLTAATGIVKLFAPEAAGLFRLEEGGWIFGLRAGRDAPVQDVLGWLYIPLALGIGAAVYVAATKLLPRLVGRG